MTHSKTLTALTIHFYAATMLFFAALRFLRIDWFWVSVDIDYFSPMLDFAVRLLLRIITAALAVKTLSGYSWRKASLLGLAIGILPFYIQETHAVPAFAMQILDIAMGIAISIFANRKYPRAVGWGLMYMALIYAYSLLFVFARNYPLFASYPAHIQVLMIADYYLFVLVLALSRRNGIMFNFEQHEVQAVEPRCFGWIGHFDNIAFRIGNFLAKPFMKNE